MDQKLLKEILDYNPETGIFIRKVTLSYNAKKGNIAGYKTTGDYLSISINNKRYMMHRLAWLYMTGEWPQEEIDHINHVRDDNRWCNLREVSRWENMKNKSISKLNTSGIVGVSWNKQINQWAASITVNGNNKFLGNFDNLEDAIAARLEANKLYNFHPNHGHQ